MKVYRVSYRARDVYGLASLSTPMTGFELQKLVTAAVMASVTYDGMRLTEDDIEIIAVIELAEGRPLV